MSELEYLKGQLADTENAICREEKKQGMANIAQATHDLYQAFLDAGFDKEQAWWFVGTAFAEAIK